MKYALLRAAVEMDVQSPSIQPEAVAFFQNQAWPGNVRELENVVRQSLLLARGYPVSIAHAQQAYARDAETGGHPRSDHRWLS